MDDALVLKYLLLTNGWWHQRENVRRKFVDFNKERLSKVREQTLTFTKAQSAMWCVWYEGTDWLYISLELNQICNSFVAFELQMTLVECFGGHRKQTCSFCNAAYLSLCVLLPFIDESFLCQSWKITCVIQLEQLKRRHLKEQWLHATTSEIRALLTPVWPGSPGAAIGSTLYDEVTPTSELMFYSKEWKNVLLNLLTGN